LEDDSIHWVVEAGDVLFFAKGNPFTGIEKTEEPVGPHTRLAAVVPTVIIGIAQNYRLHAMEMNSPIPERPIFFMKTPTAVQDPGQPIRLPRQLRSDKVDYEVELVVVIGRDCKNVSIERALECVAGFMVGNDVSARDWQKEWGGGQFCRGKTFDTFCPLGETLVTPDELDVSDLRIRSWVNDELRQDSRTSDMIFNVAELIAFVSGSTTLPAGTLLLTGTPSGVGAGMNPPVFLAPGDQVRMEIEGIGALENGVELEENACR